MSDTVFTLGMNSSAYYRELQKTGRLTEREAVRMERRLSKMESRVEKSYLNTLASADKHRKANAVLSARIDRDMMQAERLKQTTILDVQRRAAERTASIQSQRVAADVAVHRKLAARTALYHRRMEMQEAQHGRRMVSIRRAHELAGGLGGRMLGASAIGTGLSRVGVHVGTGSMGRLARFAPAAGVGAAGLGVAFAGVAILREAAARDAQTRANYRQAGQSLRIGAGMFSELVDDSIWYGRAVSAGARRAASGIGAVGGAVRRGITRTQRGLINAGAAALGADPFALQALDTGRDASASAARGRAQEQARKAREEAFFGVDPAEQRMRDARAFVKEHKIDGTPEGDAILNRVRSEQDDAARREAAASAGRARADAEMRRSQIQMINAQTATERASGTDGSDDDRAAAALMRLARLEESRARIMNDESIPAGEKQNQIMAEASLIAAEYGNRLRAIDDADQARTAHTERERVAREKTVASFKEQLAIEEAMALGQHKRAAALRAEADARRRLEEIERLGLTGDARARAEASVANILEAQMAGPKRSHTEVAFAAGLAGGDTLRRQMGPGSGGPASDTARNTGETVKLLREIRDRATVAVAG